MPTAVLSNPAQHAEVAEEPVQFKVLVEYPEFDDEGAKEYHLHGARIELFSNHSNRWETLGDIEFPQREALISVNQTGNYCVRYRILTRSVVGPDGNAHCLRASDPSPSKRFTAYTVPSARPTAPVVMGTCPSCESSVPSPADFVA